MTIDEIKVLTGEGINTRMLEIQNALSSEDADIDALTVEMDALEARKAELISAEEARKAQAAKVAKGIGTVVEEFGKEDKNMTIEELRSSEEYNKAFAQFIRTGNDAEIRSLTTTLVATGDAVAIPQIIVDGIEHAWAEQPLLAGIRKVYVKGVVQVPVETAADAAVIHTENSGEVTEEDLTIVNITITPQMIKKWIGVTDELLGMSDANLLQYVRDEIAQRIVEKACEVVVNAIIASTANGNVNAGNTATLAADPAFTDLLALMAAAEKANNPVFLMTRAEFFGKVMAMTDQADRPIWNAVSEGGKLQYMVMGIPVHFVEMPTGYTRFYAFGEEAGIMANMPNGQAPEILVDPYTLATADKVRVIGKLLFGAAAVKPDAFAVAVTQ